jgi:hypothetical protein
MHDYNHQNGTHREMFKITEVHFDKFLDNGHHSEAFYHMPTAPNTLQEKLKNPALMMLPNVLHAHLENFFPHLVIFHANIPAGQAKQCHIFIPESENKTRTYILVFGKFKNPIFNFMGKQFLSLAKTVVDQDADILTKIYPNTPKKIKLNNEVGMDWVRRNFENFPMIEEQNF